MAGKLMKEWIGELAGSIFIF